MKSNFSTIFEFNNNDKEKAIELAAYDIIYSLYKKDLISKDNLLKIQKIYNINIDI